MQKSCLFLRTGFFARLAMGAFLLLIIGLGVSLESVLDFSIAHADSGTAQFGLQPVVYDPSNPLTKSYFIFDSKPGVVINSRVRVTNVGNARGSVSLYPVDASTGQTSGAIYLGQNDPRKDVGAWMTLGAQQLTLNPGQSEIVPFQVTIPTTVRAGQHLGGIVAENVTQPGSSTPTPTSQKNTSSIQITVKDLTIVAVQVNLPGAAVEQLAATGVQAGGDNGYQSLLVGLSNSGNVMLKPSGTLQVADSQGHLVKNFSLGLDTFLPQTTINYPVYIKGQALGAGDYQATLNLTYGHGQVLHYSTRFTVTQKQIAQTFSSTASQTQAPAGFGNTGFGSMPLWQLILVAGGGLAILWVAGNMVYRRVVVSRAKPAARSSQFKKPTF